MRHLFKTLIAIMLGLAPALSSATTVSGTFKYNGTPFTGSMTFTLVYPGSTGTYLNLPIESAPVPLTDGTFSPFTVDGNDTMLPSKTYYVASVYDLYGAVVTRLPFYITGSTFDLGAAVPTPVLANNLSFLDLLGLRSLSVQQLTLLAGGSLTIGTTTVSASGITGALQINSILFAASYAAFNPSTNTCGIQEAIASLPSTGGIVILPRSSCAVTTTILAAKPVLLLGFGQGGWTDAAHTQASAGTTLINSVGGGGPMIAITPTGTDTRLHGVTLQGFAIKGASGVNSTMVAIGKSDDSLSSVSNITLRSLFIYNVSLLGVDVWGNSSNLHIEDSEFYNSSLAAPVTFHNSFSSGSPSITGTLINHCTFDHNYSGVQVEGDGVNKLRITNSQFTTNSNSGVSVNAVVTTTSLVSFGNNYDGNRTAVLLNGGFGHTFEADSITNSIVSGINVNNAPATTRHAAIIRDVTWDSNPTDIVLSSSPATTLLYPSTTGLPTTSGSGTLQKITVTPSTPY